MSIAKNYCSNLQLLPKGYISSNSDFYYVDETKYDDNNIFIHDGFEKNICLKYNKPLCHQNAFSLKHPYPEIDSAFDKAIAESEKTKLLMQTKCEITEQKREHIKDIVKERNKIIKEKEMIEKKKLEETLVSIIKDSLKFTKENSPMIAMMPSKVNDAINELKEKRKLKKANQISASLGNSFNLSMISSTSTNQQKYESNAFLKALGLDLQNLTPETIKIDIDEAYNFIKKWRVNRSDINQIIRMKVVNEIMNVEERRSVQKLKSLSSKYKKYMEYKSNKEINIKPQIIENSFEDNENITTNKAIDTQNLVEEIKEIIREDESNKNIVINPSNTQSGSKINLSKSDNNTTLIGKSTNYTIKKTRDNISNIIESSQNVLSSNFSNSNNFNNISSSYLLSMNQTLEKNANLLNRIVKDEEKISENLENRNIKNSKNNITSPFSLTKKVDYRLKPKPEPPAKKKRKLVLNSYKNIDRIIKIINNSENLKNNENLLKHFKNIRYNKKIDDLTVKLLNMNKLSIANYEEIDINI